MKTYDEQGAILIRGNQGPQGVPGSQGAFGGPQGDQGDRGYQGYQGPQGFQGYQGLTGSGADGADGPTGGFTVFQQFTTATTPPPSDTQTRFNADPPSDATHVYISALDPNGADISAILDQVGVGDFLKFFQITSQNFYVYVEVTSVSKEGGYYDFGITHLVSSPGLMVDGEPIGIGFEFEGERGFQGYQGNQGNQGLRGFQGFQGFQGMQGASGAGTQGAQGGSGTQGPQGFQGATGIGSQGMTGARGAVGGYTIEFRYENTASAPPSQTEVRFNNTAPGSASLIFIDDLDRYGTDVKAAVARFSVGDWLKIFDPLDLTKWLLTEITTTTFHLTYAEFGFTVLDFSLPSGSWIDGTFLGVGIAPMGFQGNQGFQGFQGNQGSQGLRGFQGFQGFQGNQGNQGSGVAGASIWRAARVAKDGSAQTVTSGGSSVLTFQTELYDSHGFFTLANPTVLTAPTTGFYQVSATICFVPVDSSIARVTASLEITIAGADFIFAIADFSKASSIPGVGYFFNLSGGISMVAGETVKLRFTNGNASSVQVIGNAPYLTQMSICGNPTS